MWMEIDFFDAKDVDKRQWILIERGDGRRNETGQKTRKLASKQKKHNQISSTINTIQWKIINRRSEENSEMKENDEKLYMKPKKKRQIKVILHRNIKYYDNGLELFIGRLFSKEMAFASHHIHTDIAIETQLFVLFFCWKGICSFEFHGVLELNVLRMHRHVKASNQYIQRDENRKRKMLYWRMIKWTEICEIFTSLCSLVHLYSIVVSIAFNLLLIHLNFLSPISYSIGLQKYFNSMLKHHQPTKILFF